MSRVNSSTWRGCRRRSADHQIVHHGGRGLADGAARRRRRRRPRPSRRRPAFTRRVTSSPHVGLTWCTSASNGSRSPRPVRVLVVVQDELLVQRSSMPGDPEEWLRHLHVERRDAGRRSRPACCRDTKRRPRRRRDAVAQVERAGAVVSDPHGHPEVVVQDLPDVVRVDPLDGRSETAPPRSARCQRADHPQPRDRPRAPSAYAVSSCSWRGDGVHAESRTGSRSRRRGRSASTIGGVPASNLCGGGARRSSGPSRPPRSSRRRPGTAASPRAARRGPTARRSPRGRRILWPVKTRKSTPSAGDVDRLVGHRLGGVEHISAPTSRAAASTGATGLTVPRTFDWCTKRDDLRALGDELAEVGQVEAAVVGDGEPPQRRAGALRAASATARCWSGAPSR